MQRANRQTVNVPYWEQVYRNQMDKVKKVPPSQFAAFCASELSSSNIKHIIDIAAGNGRDSIFFAEQNFTTFAIEKCRSAVELIRSYSEKITNLKVIEHDMTLQSLKIEPIQNLPVAYYSRFFIHTLSSEELNKFMNCMNYTMNHKDLLFLEYRNIFDRNRTKETPEHFRAFHSSQLIIDTAKENNLTCIYQVEGTGFAKWKKDDAYVTRQIFEKLN